MALAGIVLGTVAPTTAQAATSALDENMQPLKDGKGRYVDMKNGAGAYATDATQANATSDANVEVVSGFLTLDAVPDFSFGRAIEGKTVDLMQGQEGYVNDGNQEGLLQITESRNDPSSTGSKDATSGAVNKGFNLTAKLGAFHNVDGSALSDKIGKDNQFVLSLKPQNVFDVDSKAPNGLQTNAATLTAGDDTAQTILDNKNTKIDGTMKAVYNTSNAASLKVPTGTKADNKVQKYFGEITWTLDAKSASTPQA